MKRLSVLSLLGCAAVMAGCGGSVDLTCDEVRTYQRAQERPRVQAPSDLDPLDPLRELAVPDASPQAPRPQGSACVDRPPGVKIDS